MSDISRVGVAIIGSGNIGTDLMIKVQRHARYLKLAAMAGVDRASDGLVRAERLGVATTAGGIDGLLALPEFQDVKIVFDASSAGAHARHAEVLSRRGVAVIDLTPAELGPFVVPSVNLDVNLDSMNVNMVTCGGQATIPIVRAVSDVALVHYAEIVASISSRSAGPGTRANIDEFTETTSRAIEFIGGAMIGKAIIILNPAEPPLPMRDTVYCLVGADANTAQIDASIQEHVQRVSTFVAGYRLKQAVQFDRVEWPARFSKAGVPSTGIKVSAFLEVEGAAHYLPSYAGNLDIMTAAALRTADQMAARRLAT